jgi:hypothetical protein
MSYLSCLVLSVCLSIHMLNLKDHLKFYIKFGIRERSMLKVVGQIPFWSVLVN